MYLGELNVDGKSIMSICCFYKIHIYLKKKWTQISYTAIVVAAATPCTPMDIPIYIYTLVYLRGRVLGYDALQRLKDVLIFSNSTDPDVMQP